MIGEVDTTGLSGPCLRVDVCQIDHLHIRDTDNEINKSPHPGPLGGRMARIDDRKAKICRPNCPMVRNVACHQSVRSIRCGGNEVRTGPGDNCHPVEVAMPIAGDSQTIGTEGIRNKSVERGEGTVEVTHSTDVGDTLRRVAAKRLQPPEFECGCEEIGGSAGGGVKVGVSHKEVHPHRHQAKSASLGGASGHQPVSRLEEKRVIGHQQIDGRLLQSLNDLFVHLMTDAGTLDRRVRVAELETDRVPGGSVFGSGALCQRLGEITNL